MEQRRLQDSERLMIESEIVEVGNQSSPDSSGSSTPAPSVMTSEDWITRASGQWWVLHTRARHEKVVAEALARKSITHYLPLVSIQRTYAKCRVTVQLPLFPGYMFLCGGDNAYETALKTNRIVNILQVEDQDQFRTELTQVCKVVNLGTKVDVFKALRKGQRCRITGGSLMGLEGIVLRRGRHCRMYLCVTMLGQSAVVEVDGALLEVID